MIGKTNEFPKMFIVNQNRFEMVVGYPSPASQDGPRPKKSPEMNELESYLRAPKIWAHNSKNSLRYIDFSFWKKKYFIFQKPVTLG